jgi:TolB-like protein/tRNA A-37 threonylcarbamoyl transferase component Bud32/Tfp pilus assembly protein PilF
MTDLRVTLERTLGDLYVFERELQGGAMSRVFLAMDRQLGREIVMKVLPPEVAAELSADRFRREIQLAAKLQHAHIVPLLSSGEVDGTPYFTMPFVEGESLRARLARVGELPIPEAVRILHEVASAVSYAHKHGVIHRDIKPDNVMLSDEIALVTDFGVAKALSASTKPSQAQTLTGLGITLGTPAYMAPEQATADPSVDHRADIYAFGVMAYEMLTGTLPFVGRTTQATLVAHAIEKPEPIERRRPGIPPALGALIMHCLEKRPADRPQNAGDLLHELEAVPVMSASPPKTGGRRMLILAGAAAAIVLAALIVFRGSRRNSAAADQPVAQIRSVAVLPLANIGGDTQDEYFSEGMTDELANALSKLPGLRVASRTSAYAFKGKKDIDVGEIGRKLHVQAILEGVVRRSGDRLRVGAQLTNVSDGLAIWSDTYERRTSDVFAVQDDIARSIADALKLRLGGKASQLSSSSHGTENLEAYDAYLRGRYFWNRRGAANLRKALSYFEKSIGRDSGFARAYAGLAITHAILPEYTDTPPADGLAKTRSAAARALALDSSLAEAHTALGLAAVHAWDFPAGETEYRKAIELDPGYPTAHQWYGELLYHTGRLDSSFVETRQAIALDPLAPIPFEALGYALSLAGRYDEAIEQYRKADELSPGLTLSLMLLGDAQLQVGQTQQAVQEYEQAAGLDRETLLTKGKLCHAYGVAGRAADARTLLTEIEARAGKEPASWVPRAICHLGLGNRSAALDAMETATRHHEIAVFTAYSPLLDRTWDPVRADPRWNTILRSANLASYMGNARKP